MNTKEVIKNLAERLDQSQVKTREDLNATLGVFKNLFGDEVGFSLQNFGTFHVHLKDGRKLYDLNLEKNVMTPKKQQLEFIPSNALKDSVKDKNFE